MMAAARRKYRSVLSSSANGVVALLSFALLCSSLFIGEANGEKVMLLLGIYPARAANFGAEIPDYEERVNLMLPPVSSNGSLCEIPDRLIFDNNSTTTANADMAVDEGLINAFDSPIALLLRNDCSAEQQALMAAKLQKDVSEKVRYIVIQGNPEDGDFLKVLSPNNDPPPSSTGTIGVLYITYRTGLYIEQHIARRQAMWGGSPYFLDPSSQNFYWSLFTNIELYNLSNSRGSSGGRTDNFYWFRVLLFTLLIVSPCCRAGYLWWAGGGRIRFRRNEEGRVVGVQYIP